MTISEKAWQIAGEQYGYQGWLRDFLIDYEASKAPATDQPKGIDTIDTLEPSTRQPVECAKAFAAWYNSGINNLLNKPAAWHGWEAGWKHRAPERVKQQPVGLPVNRTLLQSAIFHDIEAECSGNCAIAAHSVMATVSPFLATSEREAVGLTEKEKIEALDTLCHIYETETTCDIADPDAMQAALTALLERFELRRRGPDA